MLKRFLSYYKPHIRIFILDMLNPEHGDEGILTVTFYTSSYSFSRVELATVEIVIGP